MAFITHPKDSKITLKLMLHKGRNKVIFAEADNNFVDTIFSIMTLPLGAITRLLWENSHEKPKVFGSLQNLYKSVMDLPANYFSTEESKFLILNPRSSSHHHCKKLRVNIDDTDPMKYFLCAEYNCTAKPEAIVSPCNFTRCNGCGNIMILECKNEDLTPSTDEGGCILQLLFDHGINDAGQCEEWTFNIDREQILMFLKGALLFNASLTHLVYPSLTHFVYPSTRWNHQLAIYRPATLLQSFSGCEIKSERMKLKVTLCSSTSNFLFAEADEDFIHFVFGFLEIPLGTVIGKLLNGVTSVVSLDNLYASISKMKVGKSIKSQDLKNMLLEPQLDQKYLSKNQIFPLNVPKISALYSHILLADDLKERFESITCYKNNRESLKERYFPLTLKDPRVQGSFLKASAKFMLMDDLTITPLSPFSTLTLLHKLQVPLNDIEVHELSIGIYEGLKILKAALGSSVKCLSPLTDALLKKN